MLVQPRVYYIILQSNSYETIQVVRKSGVSDSLYFLKELYIWLTNIFIHRATFVVTKDYFRQIVCKLDTFLR